MFARWEDITVREFDFGTKNPLEYTVKLKDATVEQVIHSFADMMCHELVERLTLAEILCVKTKSKVNFARIKKYLDSKLSKINVKDAIEEYQKKRFRSEKQEREFLEAYNIPVLPITDQLIYSYDKINETNMNNEVEREERERLLGWADMMGWTGRRISPKQTL